MRTKLQAAGVSVTRLHAPDMHHNFPYILRLWPGSPV